MTAAVGLYVRLGLPEPWNAPTKPLPLIVYGASGAVVCDRKLNSFQV
jgi:NADPH2:quinone reductase